MKFLRGVLLKRKSRKRIFSTQGFVRYEIKDAEGLLEGELFIKKTIDGGPFEMIGQDTVTLKVV